MADGIVLPGDGNSISTDDIGGNHVQRVKLMLGANDADDGTVAKATRLPTEAFLIEVQKGNVPGHSLVHKFGRNDGVPNATWEFVTLLGHTVWPLSAATTVRIKAGGDGADTAAGAGATEVTVQGIDDNFNEVTEVIATAGASASSATSTSFWRVHRAWVSGVGTYGAANTAAVIIENSAGGTDLIEIEVEEGQTQFAGWTVPIGKTAYLLSAFVTVDGVKAADVKYQTRGSIDVTVAPMKSVRLKKFWDGVLGELFFSPKSPSDEIVAKSDIWFEARGSGGTTEVSVDFELLVVDD